MARIANARVAILATDGYERSELRAPLEQLRTLGARVDVVSPKAGDIRSWDAGNWGDSVPVDRRLDAARVADYDALVLPGGQINPDLLRAETEAVRFVAAFVDAGKTVAAICHGPWMLVEADALRGRMATSFHSIRTDVENAGARWRDEAVVSDQGIITSRAPQDLPAFIAKIVEEIEADSRERAA